MYFFTLFRKAQLSIFILIAVLIITLFFFLFFFEFEERGEKIQKIQREIKNQNVEVELSLEKSVELCHRDALRKALIISGIRGGRIAKNESEIYVESFIPASYENSFLDSFSLYENSFLDSTFLHHNAHTNMHSISLIKKDFERFISSEFGKCFSVEEYLDLGFEVKIDNSTFLILRKINKTVIEVEGNLDENLGEIILFYEGRYFVGGILNHTTNTTNILFNQNLSNQILNNDFNLNPLYVFGVSLPKILVSFEDESVSSILNFPLILQKGTQEIFFEDSIISEQNRFLKLQSLAEKILFEKLKNKSNSISDINLLRKAVENSGAYFDGKELYDLSVSTHILADEEGLKVKVFSLIDNFSKVFEAPYVFNFAYKNSAPKLNFSTSSLNKVNDEIYFDGVTPIFPIRNLNQKYTFDFSKISSDFQIIDRLKPLFIAKNLTNLDFEAEIFENGTLNFIAKKNGRHRFIIELSDGEAIRNYNFDFLANGNIIENIKNSASKFCFKIKQKGSFDFPIETIYLDEIFTETSESADKSFFYYTENSKDLEFSFSQNCVPNSGSSSFQYSVNSGTNSIIGFDKWVSLNPSSSSFEIRGDVVSTTTGQTNLEPFVLKGIKVGCLGPLGECCNLTKLPSNSFTNSYISNLMNTLIL